jgi:peptidylprolyl isomerase
VIAEGQLPKKIKVNETYSTTSGLQIMFNTINSKNIQPKSGGKVKVHIIGKLANDTVFINSYNEGTPLPISIGETKIKGLDEGLTYMHKGDKALLTVPPALGFGDKEMNNIPANSTLLLTVELVDIIDDPIPYDAKEKDTISLPSGLKYIVVSKGRGIKVDSGMIVKVHYTGFFEDGKIFDSSVERGEPIEIPIGKGKVIKGWDEGITHLYVGDKAKLFIPYHLAYGETARGPIPAKSNLIFDVEIIKAEKPMKAEPYNVEGKDTVTTASGLKYIIVDQGSGVQAAKGKTAKVHYTGYFTNGSMFDSSVESGEAFSFMIGKGQVIKGWDEGVALMKTGSKYRFIIPYDLGYGENDNGPIPGKSILIFDVELLEVK